MTMRLHVPGYLTAADTDARIMHGLAVPWNVRGNTSAGPTVMVRGSIMVPADPSNVKLCWEHDRTEVHGHAVSFLDTPAALLATLRADDTERGTLILNGAAGKMRDGLSVGVDVLDAEYVDDVLHVTAAFLREISSVGVPAWNDARAALPIRKETAA